MAATTVLPCRTRPASGSTSPSSSRSRVVFPEPFTPTSPTRSPGARRQVTPSRSTRRSGPVPNATRTSSTSMTSLPRRAVAVRVSSRESLGGGSPAISAAAASSRNRGLLVRAGAPRRSQASSLRSRLARRSWVVAATRARSARVSTYAAYPPSKASTTPSCTSQVRSQTASRNQRSWVTTASAPRPAGQRERRWSASQATPSTSRWLVGSSSSSTSRRRASSAASAVRRRWPPDSVVTGASSPPTSAPSAPSRPVTTSRARESAAQVRSSACSPSTRSRIRPPDVSSLWASRPMEMPRVWVTRPESGSCTRASTRSRVDLPSPLRPTTPIRMPSSSPRETASSTVRVAWATLTDSAFSKWAIAGQCPAGPSRAPKPEAHHNPVPRADLGLRTRSPAPS